MVARSTTNDLVLQVPAALATLLDVPEAAVEVVAGPELVVRAAGHAFAVLVLGVASPGVVSGALALHLAAVGGRRRQVVPLVAVPFMTEGGRRVCAAAKVGWFDFSGNAHIVAPGVRILVDGRPSRFRAPGRPASVFAPKSARVVRWLLVSDGRAFTQREIARATDMTEGFVSRIVSRLTHESYVVREATGALRVKDPRLLLDAWRDEYRFDKHAVVQGHVAARSGAALARVVSETLTGASVEHAATGLAAAWRMTHFAAFRVATFFVARSPSKELRDKLGFREAFGGGAASHREDPRAANLWLVTPNDVGVFHGAAARDGMRCVHPVQAYVDLKAHPERAAEAAERLQSELLHGGTTPVDRKPAHERRSEQLQLGLLDDAR